MKVKAFKELTLEELQSRLKAYIEKTEGCGMFIEDMEEEIARREEIVAHKEMFKKHTFFYMH